MLAAFKQNLWRWRAVLIAVPSVAGVIMLLRLAGVLQILELASLDQLFLLRPQEAVDSRILIVTIDEADIQKFQQYPIRCNTGAAVEQPEAAHSHGDRARYLS